MNNPDASATNIIEITTTTAITAIATVARVKGNVIFFVCYFFSFAQQQRISQAPKQHSKTVQYDVVSIDENQECQETTVAMLQSRCDVDIFVAVVNE